MASSDFFVLNVNLKGENKMGNLIQYIIQEDPEKEDLEFRRKTFFPMRKINFTDKYKHAFMNL